MSKKGNENKASIWPDGFPGFDQPRQNYFKLPNSWIDITARIANIAELKVVQYILRHTWGYQEYGIKKHITVDEFMHGRRRRDGSRMDAGTGLSERSVRYGIADALSHGLIEEFIDDSDRGRVKKYYGLKMRATGATATDGLSSGSEDEEFADGEQDLQPGVQSLHPGVQELPARGQHFAPRTEKETLERHYGEKQINSNKRNSNLFPSNSVDAELSTSLRRQRSGEPHRDADPLGDDPDSQSAPTGWSTLAQVAEGLARRGEPQSRAGSSSALGSSGRSRPPKAPEFLAVTIEEITHRLNDDPTHVRSNTTRATKLWKYSGLPEDKFVTSVLYQARSLAQQQGNVTKRATAGAGGPINRVPYFFAVVEDLLGLRDTAADRS